MGIQFLETKSQPTMKVLLIVALVIAAAVATPEAEADADAAAYYYGSYMNRGYGWGRGFYGFGGYNRFGGYYGNRWGNYNNYYGRRFYKRSADAEPEAEAEADADAAVYYTTAYGYPQYQQYYGLTDSTCIPLDTHPPIPTINPLTLMPLSMEPGLSLPITLTVITPCTTPNKLLE